MTAEEHKISQSLNDSILGGGGVEFTILMPCLNEAETIEICVKKAKSLLEKENISGEVLIADNGSTDGSQQLAEAAGARVVPIPEQGYGAALIGGCNAALGKYVIMGDADDSYDLSNLMPFVESLRQGNELVMGNRFKGGIKKGAMPFLHKYLGNPVLSWLGRLFFKVPIGDFHCGLRGYNAESMRKLNLRTTGMEYASEMVVQAAINELKIAEVPTTLSPDGRSRPPHLRTWRDGWRHLKFLLMYAPNWMFLYPGIIFVALGIIFSSILAISSFEVLGVQFDINTLLYSCAMVIVGFNLMSLHAFTKTYAINAKFIKADKRYLQNIGADSCTPIGILLTIAGIVITIAAFHQWGQVNFGDLQPTYIMRLTIPAMTFVVIGIQTVFIGFMLDILRIEKK